MALAAPACIISGDKCGAHQVELNNDDTRACVCEPGAVINASGSGCTPCGANEEVKDNICVCEAGYARAAGDGGTCEPSEVGTACSGDAECPSSYPYCASADSESGYCTLRDCTSNADCPQTYTCEEKSGVQYCRQAPTGLGASCSSSGDCAAFEASYCDTLQTHTCIIAGCAAGQGSCRNEWGCCDFSALVGAPLSVCVQPEALTSGCPLGGMLVKP